MNGSTQYRDVQSVWRLRLELVSQCAAPRSFLTALLTRLGNVFYSEPSRCTLPTHSHHICDNEFPEETVQRSVDRMRSVEGDPETPARGWMMHVYAL